MNHQQLIKAWHDEPQHHFRSNNEYDDLTEYRLTEYRALHPARGPGEDWNSLPPIHRKDECRGVLKG